MTTIAACIMAVNRQIERGDSVKVCPEKIVVCNGSLADVAVRSSHVRFTPESRHCGVRLSCPLRATNRPRASTDDALESPNVISRYSNLARPCDMIVKNTLQRGHVVDHGIQCLRELVGP
jgi:hypothetical protein